MPLHKAEFRMHGVLRSCREEVTIRPTYMRCLGLDNQGLWRRGAGMFVSLVPPPHRIYVVRDEKTDAVRCGVDGGRAGGGLRGGLGRLDKLPQQNRQPLCGHRQQRHYDRLSCCGPEQVCRVTDKGLPGRMGKTAVLRNESYRQRGASPGVSQRPGSPRCQVNSAQASGSSPSGLITTKPEWMTLESIWLSCGVSVRRREVRRVRRS